ncbi:MAG: DUF3817 domain-containing protein [bacterium]
MNTYLGTHFGRFRIVSLLEGLSYLVLCGIAMPMKYIGGEPLLVQIFGRIHGALFVIFVLALVAAWLSEKWHPKTPVLAFALSLVPLGAFVLEHHFRKADAR